MDQLVSNPVIDCQKHLFSLPEDIAYVNCAYQGPFLKKVEEVGLAEVRKKSLPFQITRSDFFDPVNALRAEFGMLVNADPERIAIQPSVSYSIATVARNIDLKQGDEILLADEQFPSNYYSWERKAQETGAKVVMVGPPKNSAERGKEWNERILAAITPATKVVSMGNIHWADGTLFDLKAIGDKAREVGAWFIVDGSQSIGALPFDVEEIKPDALFCVGYKWLLGPYGISLGYYSERFDEGEPIEENWINRLDSDKFENLVNYQSEYSPKAARYNVGEVSNFMYVKMLAESLRQINEWTPAAIQQYCRSMTEPVLDRFRDLGCWIEDPDYRSHHLFGIRLPDSVDVIELKKSLDARNIFVSIRGNSIRISPHLYNETKHLESLLEGLREITS